MSTLAPDYFRHITPAEAQRSLGIPAATVRSWARRRKLTEVARDSDGNRWYWLDDVLELAEHRRERRVLA